eukprot:gene54634-10095_t
MRLTGWEPGSVAARSSALHNCVGMVLRLVNHVPVHTP